MNTRSEKIETTEDDPNLNAVSEVEAGIRDFVRNDIAYLRRPQPSMLGTTESPPVAPPDGNAAAAAAATTPEATVNNLNSLIQRVAGTSLAEIENLIGELESLRDLLRLHVEKTGSTRAQRILSEWADLSPHFVHLTPLPQGAK